MAEGAALLVDEVLPQEPMRQWAPSVPFAMRYLVATDPAVMGQVLGIVYRAIASHLIKAASYHLRAVVNQWGQTRLIFHRDHQSVEILGPADQAPNHVKRHGGNLVCCYEDLMASSALPTATVAQGAR